MKIIQSSDSNSDISSDQGTIVLEDKPELKEPPLYQVVLLNDDFTPMDFVIYILQKVFHKDEQQAVQVMLEIHTKGKAQAGLYSLQIAEQKAYDTKIIAKENNFPLDVVVQEIA